MKKNFFASQDEVDKETIHLLVFLFMQFLSQADQAVIPGEKEALWSCLLAMIKSVQCRLGSNLVIAVGVSPRYS